MPYIEMTRGGHVQRIADDIDRAQLVTSYNRDVPPYEVSEFVVEDLDRTEIKNNVDETGRLYPSDPVGWFQAVSEPEVSYEIDEDNRYEEDPAWVYTESCEVIKDLCLDGQFVPVLLLTVDENAPVKWVRATDYKPDLGSIVAVGGDISFCENPEYSWSGQKYDELYDEITNPNESLAPPIEQHEPATAW